MGTQVVEQYFRTQQYIIQLVVQLPVIDESPQGSFAAGYFADSALECYDSGLQRIHGLFEVHGRQLICKPFGAVDNSGNAVIVFAEVAGNAVYIIQRLCYGTVFGIDQLAK
ncbi:hypothetical protein D9M69_662590 [compost metagenome]